MSSRKLPSGTSAERGDDSDGWEADAIARWGGYLSAWERCRGAMLSQGAVSKMARNHAASAHESCPEVPLGLYAHQMRHACHVLVSARREHRADIRPPLPRRHPDDDRLPWNRRRQRGRGHVHPRGCAQETLWWSGGDGATLAEGVRRTVGRQDGAHDWRLKKGGPGAPLRAAFRRRPHPLRPPSRDAGRRRSYLTLTVEASLQLP